MSQNRTLILIVVAAAIVFTAMSAVCVVNERERVVVVRFGEIARVEEIPGLHVKAPYVEEAYPLSARLLGHSEEAQTFRTGDGKDVVADIDLKWRIVDARQFYLSAGAQETAGRVLLRQAVVRRLGEEFGKRTLKSVTGGEWRQLTEALTVAADKDTRKSGIEIVDVRLQRVSVSTNQTVFERMRAERARVANERRAQGVETADKVRADAERARDAVLAEGYARSERIRGEGDARAAAIYANAGAVAPEFLSFYLSLNAYKQSFKKKDDVLVLDPSSDFFKYMRRPTR